MLLASDLQRALEPLKKIPPEKAAFFFKIGPGEYAEHDRFLGITTPDLRKVARQFQGAPLGELGILLHSPFNEERLLALFILVLQYQSTPSKQQNIHDFYKAHLPFVNNWNLVDASAHLILGAHLSTRDRTPLLSLVLSQRMWERRVAIVATWFFIRRGECDWTFKLAESLLRDPHDLIHKATGWMLREAGKQNIMALLAFLDQNAPQMPRAMLRYSLEKLPPPQRAHYLSLGKNRG